MAREDLHFRLRIPENLKKQIEAAAEQSRRSMTAEIVSRLEQSFFALDIPEPLFERIENYAKRQGRTGNEEILRLLEREFPEPETIDGVVGELLDVIAVLDGGVTSSKIDQVVGQVHKTIRGVLAGRIQGVDKKERERIQDLWERYQKNQAEEALSDVDEAEMDTYALTGGTQKYGQPDLDDDEEPQADR